MPRVQFERKLVYNFYELSTKEYFEIRSLFHYNWLLLKINTHFIKDLISKSWGNFYLDKINSG